MKSYSVQMEVSGATAMWTRPDTGATPVSYPVPPWSAAKGIFESIVRLKNVIINPTAVVHSEKQNKSQTTTLFSIRLPY